jgi:restriction endonuclease S subunit
MVAQYVAASRGVGDIQRNLFYPDLRNSIAIVPPPDEQAAIVRFLDHANRKIDGFIRAKRKLIGLLNEQKQAIIHRAVTRGLHPDVPLKPSGIPWLGDIPMHWEVRRLRFCIVGKLTYGANAAAEFDNPDWPRYLRITDFNTDGSLRSDTFRSLPPEVAKDYPVEDGDILFARSGATVGKAFLVRTETEKACYAGYLIRARPNAGVVLPTFLFAFTQSTAFACWKDAIFNRATIQNIGADKYANLVVPIPPIPEQQAILDFVEKDLAPLRAAIARTEREIALMQEYRTRLTADLVTGKLDVREAVDKLPASVDDVKLEDTSDELSEEAEEEILES